MSASFNPRPIEILLVEDNPSDAWVTSQTLRDARVYNNLHLVEDGEQALDFLFRRGKYANAPRPDLILLDLNLPRLNGQEVLEVIKDDTALRRIPVIILTTSDAQADIIRAYNLHANSYITKPVGLDQFIHVVRTLDQFWLSIVKLPGE